jgi:hypothetical protein
VCRLNLIFYLPIFIVQCWGTWPLLTTKCTMLGHWWHHFVCYARLFPTLLVVITIFLVTMSTGPLLSCLGAGLWCLLSWMLAANWLTDYQSQSHIATDGQSVSKSWCRAPSEAHDQIFITLLTVMLLFFVGRSLWREDGSVFCICCWPLPAHD